MSKAEQHRWLCFFTSWQMRLEFAAQFGGRSGAHFHAADAAQKRRSGAKASTSFITFRILNTQFLMYACEMKSASKNLQQQHIHNIYNRKKLMHPTETIHMCGLRVGAAAFIPQQVSSLLSIQQ